MHQDRSFHDRPREYGATTIPQEGRLNGRSSSTARRSAVTFWTVLFASFDCPRTSLVIAGRLCFTPANIGVSQWQIDTFVPQDIRCFINHGVAHRSLAIHARPPRRQHMDKHMKYKRGNWTTLLATIQDPLNVDTSHLLILCGVAHGANGCCTINALMTL
jgi:hypothetical protein